MMDDPTPPNAATATEDGGTVPPSDRLDAIVVGAGWAGMYMLHSLREQGYAARIFEAGSGVGGTWFWNRYPGARCDIHSLAYSYSFSEELEQDWEWQEMYAAQPEIERYANWVADRLRLRDDIQLETRVISARFNGERDEWLVETSDNRLTSAKFLFMCTGGYSVPVAPDIDGLETFEGELYFTARWPETPVSFEGKRVGVVGTGSSGVQTITAIGQEPVEHLYVFQRTANFAVPGWNKPADPEFTTRFKAGYREFREASRWSGNGSLYPTVDREELRSPNVSLGGLPEQEFAARMQKLWERGGPYMMGSVSDLLTSEAVNDKVADYVREKVRERVNDPHVAEILLPRGHFVGERRIIVENGYYETFNLPNVTLVDLRDDPITAVTPTGVTTAREAYELDALVFATGFDSGTGSMLNIEIVGEDGRELSQKWATGPRTYLGLMVEGFPNMFMVAQAGSPGIRSQVMVSIEQHVEWISELLRRAADDDVTRIEAAREAEDAWTAHVADIAAKSLVARHATQYSGANVPGKPAVYLAYMGGTNVYREACERVRDNSYEGLLMTTANGSRRGESTWSGIHLGSSVLGSVI